MRPSFAYSRAGLAATALNPASAPLDRLGAAHQYALAPELAPLLPLFDAGQMGVILNVGTLVQPTTKLQYTNKSVKLPPKLFSHNDQQSVWQSSSPEGATSGWGGRIGDLFESGNGNATFTCVNVSGNAVFMSGRSAVQYQVSTGGSVPLAGLKSPLFGSSACSDALRALVSQPRAHLLENEYSRVTKRSIDADTVLTGALASSAALGTVFPSPNGLADQLRMVARMISAAPALGAKRQVFYVTLGSFDTHDRQKILHADLMARLAHALAYFDSTLATLQGSDLRRQVTTFTASDFGRTFTSNGDGTDHGWGAHHFVVGGAVRGRDIYGAFPTTGLGHELDVGSGSLLPTTSVDQYGATLAKWFGVPDNQLGEVFPNLANFSQRDLGFMATA